MKKQYIKPEVTTIEVKVESAMLAGSPLQIDLYDDNDAYDEDDWFGNGL